MNGPRPRYYNFINFSLFHILIYQFNDILLPTTKRFESRSKILVDKQIHIEVSDVRQVDAVVHETRQGLVCHECYNIQRGIRNPAKNENT